MRAITPYDEPGVSETTMGSGRSPESDAPARHRGRYHMETGEGMHKRDTDDHDGREDTDDPESATHAEDTREPGARRGRGELSGETAEETSEAENTRQDSNKDESEHASKSPIQTISIIGQVEGHVVLPSQSKTTKYEHIIPQLLNIEQDPDVKGVLVTLNTVGGDVEAGLAIAEMIASLSKPTVSLVLGGGHSIGVPIAVAAQRSFIVPTATMTIHPIRINGYVIGVPQTFEYLDKMQDRVIQFVCDHSRVSERRLRELMFRTGELARDVGTILVGESAVKEGLINEVGGLGPAIAALHHLVERQEERGGPPRRPQRTHRRSAGKGGMGPRSTPSFQRNKYGESRKPDASAP